MQEITAVKWDLSDLFSGMDDPKIEETLAEVTKRAAKFVNDFKGKINSDELTADLLCKAVKDYEEILQKLDKPVSYAYLMFSTDTSDEGRGAFLQKMREKHSALTVKLLFFELELVALSEEKISKLLENPMLSEYRHYIETERLFREFRLPEAEEKILEEKANTSSRAFKRLFDETVSNIPFQMLKDGEMQNVTLPEIVALLRDTDREVRKSAAESLTQGLASHKRTFAYIFNTLIQDKAVEDSMRKYSYPEQSRHMSNELDRETVELVVQTAVDHYPLVARYYDLKKKILGYDALTHYDRYAPLFESKEMIPYDKGCGIILDSFGKFSPKMAKIAKEFFDKNWIDAEVRKGKRGGAYCSYITPDLHPYVFVNYMNRMDDVLTLGHELGHAAHACIGRTQSYLNFAPTLPVAELASTFGEILVFESLQKEASVEGKLALYADKIEGAFATIFRQSAMYRFEQKIHEHRREIGELGVEHFSQYWQELQQEMFGDSLVLGNEHRYWWMYVSHFVSSPFYVYAYTVGELLVMSLYSMYKKEGGAFTPKYLNLLEKGGSVAPKGMFLEIGIDIAEAEFWKGGMRVLEELIDEFERLSQSA